MSNYTPKRASGGSSKKPSDAKKKQKILIIVIVAVLAVIVIAALILAFVPGAEKGLDGIFSGSGSGGYVPETQSETTIISQYYNNGILPTSGDRHDVHVINGGGSGGSELEGSWKLDEVTVYEFDGQGRGIMLTAVDNYTFLYSAENGKLAIDYDADGGTDREYDYSISGDTLTLVNASMTYTFTRNDG